jgi:polyphosphate kinase 2 (PPK2 family)
VEELTPATRWSQGYDEINEFEHDLVDWGAILLKFWVDVSPDEQLARFNARAADPAKQWKITPDDWRNRDKYPQYKAAIDDMFRLTSTRHAPWVVLESDDKFYARIKALRIICDAIESRLNQQ